MYTYIYNVLNKAIRPHPTGSSGDTCIMFQTARRRPILTRRRRRRRRPLRYNDPRVKWHPLRHYIINWRPRNLHRHRPPTRATNRYLSTTVSIYIFIVQIIYIYIYLILHTRVWCVCMSLCLYIIYIYTSHYIYVRNCADGLLYVSIQVRIYEYDGDTLRELLCIAYYNIIYYYK